MVSRILVAYDGSPPADKAFDFAADLAGRYGAALSVLTVAQPPEFGEDVETEAVIEHSRSYHQGVLDRLRARAAERGVQARFAMVVGHAAQTILDHAEAEGAELIVLGHRGRGMFDRWRLGSVTHRVISYASCPVLVVR